MEPSQKRVSSPLEDAPVAQRSRTEPLSPSVSDTSADKYLAQVDKHVKSVLKAELSLCQKYSPDDPFLRSSLLPYILDTVVNNSRGLLRPNYDVTAALSKPIGTAWNEFWEKHPKLLHTLLECLTQQPPSFQRILTLDSLKPATEIDPSTYTATLKSWSNEFRGLSAQLLHAVFQDYLKQFNHSSTCALYTIYYQSSGTGKSRAVDELAKRVVTIPLCLADHSLAFPPPDESWVRTWVQRPGNSQQEAQGRYERYLSVLLTVAKTHLEEIAKACAIEDVPHDQDREKGRQDTLNRLAKLASAFREKMNELEYLDKEDPFAYTYGAYRRGFYQQIKNKLYAHAASASSDLKPEESIETAGSTLYSFLDPTGYCRNDLLLVMAFDEAQSLMQPTPGASWTCFSALRHALRRLTVPFFTVFLSTVGHYDPAPKALIFEPFNRMQTLNLDHYEPITEVIFDKFAPRVKGDGTWTLQEIASTYQIAHLGRPLFASRYDCGDNSDRESIVDFAGAKLLGRNPQSVTQLTSQMQLACLSTCLAIGFQAGSWRDREQERIQIQQHVRLCLSASAGFREMVTINPSEPIIAEAAVNVMARLPWTPAAALLSHMDGSFLDLGANRRGQYIASLLLLLARNAALTPGGPVRSSDLLHSGNDPMKEDGGKRVVSVLDFLLALLKSEPSEVQKHTPANYLTTDAADLDLQAAFQNAHIWFNHFIKARDFEVINRNSLGSAIVRGAAIVCMNNIRDVDIVIPIVFNNRLRVENISAIIVQVKTDSSFGKAIWPVRFDIMDPFNVGLFSPDVEAPLPVIRMVFALGSREAGTTYRAAPNLEVTESEENGKANFTAYDIWCAGAMEETFKVIKHGDNEVYADLLASEPSFDPFDPFGHKDDKCATALRSRERRQMRPCAELGPDHHQNFFESSE